MSPFFDEYKQGRIIENQTIAFFTPKTTFCTMTCHNEKKPRSLIYLVKLPCWVFIYTKTELSTENALYIFGNFGNIFGET